MTTSSKPVLLITGVTSGIGLALTRKIWNTSQYNVIATARSTSFDKLKSEAFYKTETDHFHLRSLDVTNIHEQEKLIQEIELKWGGVDILINNAGIAYRAVLEHISDEDLKKQFETNFFGPISLAKKVLPSMRQKKRGKIINISSVSGMMAMPTMAAYSASKFALEGATESLWYEMRPWNIDVTLIQPGFIHSESFKHVYVSTEAQRSSHDKNDPYHFFYKNISPFIAKMMGRALATPESIADLILKTIARKNPPLRISATVDAVFFGFLRRILPRRFYHWLLYRNLPGIKEWGNKL